MSEFNQTSQNKEEEYRLPIAELYPDYTSEERAEAEYTLSRYLDLVRRIYESDNGANAENIDDSAL
jgi:hypothetical protein